VLKKTKPSINIAAHLTFKAVAVETISFRKHLKSHNKTIVSAENSESLMLDDEFEDILERPEERPPILPTPQPAKFLDPDGSWSIFIW
jgi:hypothetical protein